MKRKYIINIASVIAVLVIVAVFAYGFHYKEDDLPIVESTATFISYNEFSDLEAASQLIIRAKVLKGSENIVDYFENGLPKYGYTITPVKIVDIYKDEIELDDKEIKIYENYRVFDGLDGDKYMVCTEDYRPLKVGREYILFLLQNSDDSSIYSIKGLYQGKFPINDKLLSTDASVLTAEDFEMGGEDIHRYKKFFEEVKAKYMNQ